MMGLPEKTKGYRLYNSVRFRLNWKHYTKRQEAGDVLKGLSRKVIIVKSPDPEIFEQAIFIVRDDFLSGQGIGEKELLRQAQAAANGYVENTRGWHRFHRFPAWGYAGLGAGILGCGWMMMHLFGLI